MSKRERVEVTDPQTSPERRSPWRSAPLPARPSLSPSASPLWPPAAPGRPDSGCCPARGGPLGRAAGAFRRVGVRSDHRDRPARGGAQPGPGQGLRRSVHGSDHTGPRPRLEQDPAPGGGQRPDRHVRQRQRRHAVPLRHGHGEAVEVQLHGRLCGDLAALPVESPGRSTTSGLARPRSAASSATTAPVR